MARTGETAAEAIANLNRDTENAHNGPLDKNPDLNDLLSEQAEIADAAGKAGEAVAKTVGDIAKHFTDQYELAAANEEILRGILDDPNATEELKNQASELLDILTDPEAYERWSEGGAYKTALQAAGSALVAALGNGEALNAAMGAAASQLASGKIHEFAETVAKELTDNEFAQGILSELLTNAASAGVGGVVGGDSGAAAASTMDRYNRQLHTDELEWIFRKKAEFAAEQGISEELALQILLRQAAIQTDILWLSLLGSDNYNQAAAEFLDRFTCSGACEVKNAFHAEWAEFIDPTINLDTAIGIVNVYDKLVSNDLQHSDPLYWMRAAAASGYLLPVNENDLNGKYMAEMAKSVFTAMAERLGATTNPLKYGPVIADDVESMVDEAGALINKYLANLSKTDRENLEKIYGNENISVVLQYDTITSILGVIASAGGAKKGKLDVDVKNIIGKIQAKNNSIKQSLSVGTVNRADTGIVWAKGNKDQGLPWEDYLAKGYPVEDRLPWSFKTFDFFDKNTGRAISAKTMDTMTTAKINKPAQIYSELKKYIDDAADFETYTLSGRTVNASDIKNREIHLAVPQGTNTAQWEQIKRAQDYAKENGIIFKVTEIK